MLRLLLLTTCTIFFEKERHDGMARIDLLREEKKDDSQTLAKVERINKHIEGLAKDHEKYL